MIYKMARRNLMRNKRRTIITLVSIAFGVILCMFLTGISDGTYTSIINTAAKLGQGHMTVMNKSFLESQDLSYTVKNAYQIENILSREKDIIFTEKKISGSGMLSSAYESISVFFDAVEPEKNKKISTLIEKITEGVYLTGDERDVLIGKTLAERLKVKLGSKVVLTVNDKNNNITQELFRIRGIFRTGSENNDGFYALFTFPKLQKVLKFEKDEANVIALYVENYRNTVKLIKKIKTKGSVPFDSETDIYPWFDVMQELAQYISVDKGSNYIIQGFLLIIIAAGILNTVLMSVMERLREFGIMIALGFSRFMLWVMILCEAALLGFLGIISGSIPGWLLNYYFYHNPIDVSQLMGGEGASIEGVAFDPLLQTGLFFDHFVFIFLTILLMVILFSLYPAFKAAKTDPIEAIEKNL